MLKLFSLVITFRDQGINSGSSKSEQPPNTPKRPGHGKSLHCLINSVTVHQNKSVVSSWSDGFTSAWPRRWIPVEGYSPSLIDTSDYKLLKTGETAQECVVNDSLQVPSVTSQYKGESNQGICILLIQRVWSNVLPPPCAAKPTPLAHPAHPHLPAGAAPSFARPAWINSTTMAC